MIKNVLFDLDGTLLDTREGILESIKHAAKELGYRELSLEEQLSFVGPPIQKSFMDHYGCDKEEAQRAADIFRAFYSTQTLLMASPYDGIYELCEGLKENGIKMAVATYKREDYALTLLKHFRFHEYCEVMHGADGENVLKKEDIVRMCIEELGARKEECVLIGDTDNDAKGAAAAGIPFIAVTYGFGFKNEKDVSAYPFIGVAADPMGVLPIILGERIIS